MIDFAPGRTVFGSVPAIRSRPDWIAQPYSSRSPFEERPLGVEGLRRGDARILEAAFVRLFDDLFFAQHPFPPFYNRTSPGPFSPPRSSTQAGTRFQPSRIRLWIARHSGSRPPRSAQKRGEWFIKTV